MLAFLSKERNLFVTKLKIIVSSISDIHHSGSRLCSNLFSGELRFHGSLSVGSAAHMYVQFVMFNRNISATVLRALELANFVDMVSMIHSFTCCFVIHGEGWRGGGAAFDF